MSTWDELSATDPTAITWDSLSATPPEKLPVQGGLVASAKSAFGSLVKGAGQLAGDLPGVDDDNALKRYGQDVIDANPTAIHSLSDMAESPWTTAKEAVGNAGGSMAGMVGVRALGQGITALSPLAGPAAPAVALAGQAVAWLGPAAIAALPSYGSIREKQILNDPANNEDWKSKTVAALGAATVGAIESKFGPQNWALGAMTKEGRAALAEKFAETTLAKGLAYGALKGAAIEGGEELAQQPIEQLASYDDPTSPESLRETAFSGAMGAVGGGVMGGGFGAAFRQPQAQPAKTPAAPALQIGNTPDPYISFPDGTVGRRAEVDAYIAKQPQDQQAAMRARLMGLAPQKTPVDILNAESMDDAIQNFTESVPSNAGLTLSGNDRSSLFATPQNDLMTAAREREQDDADLSSLVQTETKDLQVMRAQAAREAQKAQELDQIPALAAEQNTTQQAVSRAATLEAPTALEQAFSRLYDKTIGPEPDAPAKVETPAPEPRVVARTDTMVPIPRELAELQVEMAGGEVVRIPNRNGKFAYTVIPKAGELGATPTPPPEEPNGPSLAAIAESDGTGAVPGVDAGTGLVDGGRIPDDAGGRNNIAAIAPVADGAAVVAARAGTADAVAPAAPSFDYTKNPSGTVLVQGDPAAIRAAFPGVQGLTKSTAGASSGVLFGVKAAPAVVAQLEAANEATRTAAQQSPPAPGQTRAPVGGNAEATQELPGARAANLEAAGLNAVTKQAPAPVNTAQTAINTVAPAAEITAPAVFVRKGDFWNYSGGRAPEIAKALDLTVTKRNGISTVGIPSHAQAQMAQQLQDTGITAEFEAQDPRLVPLSKRVDATKVSVENIADGKQTRAKNIGVATAVPGAEENRSILEGGISEEGGQRDIQVQRLSGAVQPSTANSAVRADVSDTPTAPQGRQVSFYPGKYGKGMGKEAAKLEAQRLNRTNTDRAITYAAEEHGDPKLENPWAVVGREVPANKATPQNGSSQAAVGSRPALPATEAPPPALASFSEMNIGKGDPSADGTTGGAPSQSTQATAILDAANITGKERLDVLKDVKAGTLTAEEVKEAYPGVVKSPVGDYTVNAPKKTYPNDKQLASFIDSQPDPSQAGPSVEVSRRNAVAAVYDLHATESLLAQALSSDYAARQRTSLVGQKIASNEDLAVLAQLYRDPRFETFRVIFTDAQDKAVAQIGLTSRLPGSASAIVGNDIDSYLGDLSRTAKQQGATSYFMLHNHPSGNPTPSRADQALTREFDARMPGLDFKGHVVIDTNQYAVIEGDGVYETFDKDFGQAEPMTSSQWGGLQFSNPAQVMGVARQMQVDADAVTLIVTDHQYQVKSIATVPHAAITSDKATNKMTLAKAALTGKGSQLFAVGRDKIMLLKLGDGVRDAIHIDAAGATSSMAEQGLIRGGEPFPRDRRVRLSADTSQEFGYLRPFTTQQTQGLKVAEKSAPKIVGQTARHSWDAPEASKFDDLVYKLQDKQIDTKRVIESIRNTAGALADEKDVYLQEELFHGRAAARTEDFVNKELGPLIKDMKMRGIDIATLDEYLHARHAEEANELIAGRNPDIQDGGSGMTTKAARDYLAKLGPAERQRLESVATKVDAILADTRQLYADYGLESDATVKGWGAMFKHYVPLMREDKDGGMGIGQGFSIKGKEVKGRTGSTRKVVDILANIAMQRERAIVRGEKNRVAAALVGLVKTSPNADFWQVGPPPMEKVYDPKTDSVVERADPLYKSRDHVVVAKIKQANGTVEEQAVVFNEENERAMRMAASLKNLDAAQLEGLLGVSAKISRYFAAINTQYNPIFGAVNLVRDFQGAILNLSSTPLKGHSKEVAQHTLSALKGVYLDARDARDGKTPTSSWAKLWEEFQDEGGQTGFRDMFSNSADRAKAIERELNPTAWMDGPLGKVFTANGTLKVPLELAQKTASGVFGWLSDYNLAMENAVRLSAYKVGLEQGMSKQKAASLAKNLTVNFNRKGQVGQQAGALYAFFNASMQGSARLGKTLFDMDGADVKSIRLSPTGKKIVYGGILLGTLQAMLLAAAGFDDEEPPDFVRERSLIIPTGGKGYITIPMPLGLHVLPNIGRIPTEFVLGGYKHPERQIAKLLGLVAGAFNPIGGGASLVQMLSPTAVDPLVALAENKDWTGKPIAKTSYNKAIPGHLLTKDTASYPAKVLAEAINVLSGGTEYTAGVLSPTPDQIDYLWGQATGGVGREINKVHQTISATLSGEALPVHKIPLAGRFYGNAETQSAQSTKFYAALNELNEHETEIKGLRKDGKGAEAAKYLQEHPDARMFPLANKVDLEVQKLRRIKRELVATNAPAERVKALEERITQTMKRFNESVERQKKAALSPQ